MGEGVAAYLAEHGHGFQLRVKDPPSPVGQPLRKRAGPGGRTPWPGFATGDSQGNVAFKPVEDVRPFPYRVSRHRACRSYLRSRPGQAAAKRRHASLAEAVPAAQCIPWSG